MFPVFFLKKVYFNLGRTAKRVVTFFVELAFGGALEEHITLQVQTLYDKKIKCIDQFE